MTDKVTMITTKGKTKIIQNVTHIILKQGSYHLRIWNEEKHKEDWKHFKLKKWNVLSTQLRIL